MKCTGNQNPQPVQCSAQMPTSVLGIGLLPPSLGTTLSHQDLPAHGVVEADEAGDWLMWDCRGRGPSLTVGWRSRTTSEFHTGWAETAHCAEVWAVLTSWGPLPLPGPASLTPLHACLLEAAPTRPPPLRALDYQERNLR